MSLVPLWVMFVLKPPLGHIRGANTNVHWLHQNPHLNAGLQFQQTLKPVCKEREIRECVGDVRNGEGVLSGVYHSISTFINP